MSALFSIPPSANPRAHQPEEPEFLRQHGPCQIVVEATACYEWFVSLAEPVADRGVLANPRKLRVILDPELTTSDVRTKELVLLARIKRLARFYRPDADARPDRLLDEAGAIERDVRREARPDDSEDDIQREIAHRRARLDESDRRPS